MGRNPPMAEVVNKYGLGIIAETDGRDQKAIEKAIREALNTYDTIKANIKKNKSHFLRDSQEQTIKEMILKLLN